MKNAMPWLNILRDIHNTVKVFGGDIGLDPSIGSIPDLSRFEFLCMLF